MNHLYYGDNLTIMQRMPSASVDLIYLDPPFNSQQNYNLIYKTLTGRPVPEQAEAFCDTWEMDAQKEELARKMPVLMREYGVDDYYVDFWRLWIQALRNTQPHLLAYLIYMVMRLLHMKVILKKTGSIYLHCDPNASHYIKVMMDGIFGHKNFRSEIIWRRSASHNKLSKQFGPIHDVIFFYSMSEKMVFHPGHTPYSKSYIQNAFRSTDEHGRYRLNELTGSGTRNGDSGAPWRGFNPTDKGRHWAIPLSLRADLTEQGRGMSTQAMLDMLNETGNVSFSKTGRPTYKQRVGNGVPFQDIWSYQPGTKGVLLDESIEIDQDVKWLDSEDERLGYPTQKPIGLLKRIISTSSDPGSVVFDPFCGCGTTVYAAEQMGRRWIGCDIAILSVKIIREVLTEKYRLTEGQQFAVDGIPVSVEQAVELFQRDPFQFQHWAVERAGGFPSLKKVADRGIDGRLYFETKESMPDMVISVKGGKLRPTDVRDLRGVLEREPNAEMAGLISLQTPSRAMRQEAAEAKQYAYNGVMYDRIQFLTIADMLEGKKSFHTPTKVGSKISTGQAALNFE